MENPEWYPELRTGAPLKDWQTVSVQLGMLGPLLPIIGMVHSSDAAYGPTLGGLCLGSLHAWATWLPPAMCFSQFAPLVQRRGGIERLESTIRATKSIQTSQFPKQRLRDASFHVQLCRKRLDFQS